MKSAWSSAAVLFLLGVSGSAQEAAEVAVSPGDVLWTYDSGGELWVPLEVEDGLLYFGNDGGTFTAFDLAAREPRWQFTAQGRIRSAAEIAGDSVLFASDDGFLYALERASGAERWRFDLGSAGRERRLPAPAPPFEFDYLQSAPTVGDGVVFVGSADGNLYAVDLETGEKRWRFESDGRIRSTPAVAGDKVYVGSWDGHVYALAAADGEEVWRFDTKGPVQGSPAVVADRVIVGSRKARLFGLNAATGEVEWTHVHKDGSWVESSPVVRGGVVYIGSSDARKLFAFDASSGEELWHFDTGGWSWGTPTVTEDAVYIGSLGARPYWVALEGGFYAVDRATGVEKWRLTPPASESYITGGVFSAARVVDGVVYVGSVDGRLYAIAE